MTGEGEGRKVKGEGEKGKGKRVSLAMAGAASPLAPPTCVTIGEESAWGLSKYSLIGSSEYILRT